MNDMAAPRISDGLWDEYICMIGACYDVNEMFCLSFVSRPPYWPPQCPGED